MIIQFPSATERKRPTSRDNVRAEGAATAVAVSRGHRAEDSRQPTRHDGAVANLFPGGSPEEQRFRILARRGPGGPVIARAQAEATIGRLRERLTQQPGLANTAAAFLSPRSRALLALS